MICDYYLTWQCDCYCDFCKVWRDDEIKAIPPAPAEDVAANLTALKELGIRQVNFTGGEPLMHPGIKDILSSAKARGFRVSLHTSGLIYPRMAAVLEGLIDRLHVSVDFPTALMHDQVRGQECFEEALDSLAAARSAGAEPVINFALTRESVRFLPEMVELAQEKGAGLNVMPVHHCDGLEGFEPETVDYILRYHGRKNVAVDPLSAALLKEGGNRTSSPRCAVMDHRISISPDGMLMVPCPAAGGARIPIEGKLKQVLQSDIYKGYKKLQGRLPACEGCTSSLAAETSLRGKAAFYVAEFIRPVREAAGKMLNPKS